MTARRRRPPGEGSVFEYQTRAGDKLVVTWAEPSAPTSTVVPVWPDVSGVGSPANGP